MVKAAGGALGFAPWPSQKAGPSPSSAPRRSTSRCWRRSSTPGPTRRSSPRPGSSARSAPTAACRTSRRCDHLRALGPVRRAQEPQVLRHQLPQRGDLPGARHREDRRGPVQRVLEPQRLEVTTLYNMRGGFETTCTVELRGVGTRPVIPSEARDLAGAGKIPRCARDDSYLAATAAEASSVPLRPRLRPPRQQLAQVRQLPRRHRHDRARLLQIARHRLVVGVALRVVGVEVPPRLLVEVESREPRRARTTGGRCPS